jgi:hypothetical protein
MKLLKYIVLPALLILSVSMASAQAVGDYGSAGSGRWGTTGANWVVCQTPGTWVGATPAPGAPDATTNVWIRAGHSDTVEASGKECLNLTIEATGMLVGNATLPTATIQYLRVRGTTATINGIFASSLSPGTNLALEAGATGGTLTIGGSGTFGPARLRVSSDASNATVIFDMNATFRYTGSSGTGGVALYPQTDNNTFTVNAGKTLTFVVNAGFGVSGSNRVSAAVDFTTNVYGNINMVSSTSPLTLKVTTGHTCALNIFTGSIVSVGGGIYPSSDADGGTSTLTVDGTLNAGGPVDFNNPAFVVTGTGTFNLTTTGNLRIGHTQGIASSGATGQIRTTTRSFSTSAKYSYVGVDAQVTGTGLPATVGDLLIDDTSHVTLTSSVTVSDSLILVAGHLIGGGNTVGLASTGKVDRTDGYIVGTFLKNVATGSAVARTFEIGTATAYTPVSVTFDNVSTAGNLSVSTTSGDHPNLATGNINTAKSVNRYWTLTNSGIAFTTYGAQFTFVPAELDAGAAPGVFIAERYSGGSWSGLTEGTRASTSTSITGASGFGDIAIGEDETAAPAPAFELSTATLGVGAVRIGFSGVDTAYVRNIGSATLNISSITSGAAPVFTVLPASATVAAHDSVMVRVTFTPSGTGAAQANVVFVHDALGTPDTLLATGYGTVGAVQSNGTGGGTWASATTWLGGIVPTLYDSVVVQGSDSITVLADTSCLAVTMQPGSRLGLYALLDADGAAISGEVVAQTSGRLTISDTCWFAGGAVYEHARNAGTLPTHVRWMSGSTVRFTGLVDSMANEASQDFFNVVWNCPNQAGNNLNSDWDSITVSGDVTVINTGASGRWNMTGPVTNDSSTVTIMGNIFQSGGNFTSNGTGNAGTRITIHQYGNIVVTGGNFSVSRGSQGSTGTTRWWLHGGDFSMSNATTQNSNPAGAWFIFAKAGTQTLALGTGNTLTSLPYEVANGTTLNAGTSVVRGSGLVTLDANSTIRSAHTGGFDSTFAGNGTRTFNPGANFVLDGSSLQQTGRRMADTLANLTINNAAGAVLSDSILVNGTLTLTAGDLNLNGKLVTLGASGMLSETAGNTAGGASGLITTTRVLNAPAVTTDIAGLGIGIGSALNLGSTVVSRGPAVQTVPGSYGIARYFDIVPTNNTGLNAALRFHYDDAECGTAYEPTLLLRESTDGGATWSAGSGTLNTTANTLDVTGLSSLARWTAAGQFAVPVPVTVGWNMVSNPATVANDSVRVLLPLSSFPYAFAFTPGQGYQQIYRMNNGSGYWAKFPGALTQPIGGDPLLLDTIDVSTGWNMIGSISTAVDTAAVVQIPVGTVTSRYFRFNAGYSEAATILPGRGYWVKAAAPGKLVLSGSLTARPKVAAGDPLEGFTTITITDNTGASQVLHLGETFAKPAQVENYELPPQGPEGTFDVRFATGRSVDLVAAREARTHVITLSSASYPVTVSWNVAGAMKLSLKAGEAEALEMSAEGSTVISDPRVNRITIGSHGVEVPTVYSLGQNYPNPFNPSTTIAFGLPVQSQVTVQVFNLLGQKVAEVAGGVYSAGYHDVVWNGTINGGGSASSGVYFYRIEARSAVDGQQFVDVRKMLLVK